MDPYEAWDELMEILAARPLSDEGLQEAYEIVGNLKVRLARGGFVPDVSGPGSPERNAITIVLDALFDWLSTRLGSRLECVPVGFVMPPEAEREEYGPPEPCEQCESGKGDFFAGPSGVPGVLAWLDGGKVVEGSRVERCDYCERYGSDEAAEVALAFGEGVFDGE